MWMTTVQDGDTTYSVAFRGGEIANAGVQLFDNPRHPTVVADTQRTLQRLKELHPPDLFLHNHPQNPPRRLDPMLPVDQRCASCLAKGCYKTADDRPTKTGRPRPGGWPNDQSRLRTPRRLRAATAHRPRRQWASLPGRATLLV